MTHRWIRTAWMGLTLAWGLVGAAGAEEHGPRTPLLPQYQQECAACHMAYPPGMLPAASWRRLMANLPQHFGTDASLDVATVKKLSGWLEAHAATGRRASTEPPQDRITRTAWFMHEHDEISPAVWKRASVKSPANCMACHREADRGIFEEDSVRIPR